MEEINTNGSVFSNDTIKLELENFMNKHKWGGSGIERCVFEFILNKIEPGSTIIEIGSGYCSTLAFSMAYNLCSIEHNPNYINIFDNVRYILAPLNLPKPPFSKGWYNRDSVKSLMPKFYKLVFVDGPVGEGNRIGILENLDLFRDDCIFIFHDTWREAERNLAEIVAKRLNKKVTFYDTEDYWAVVE